MAKRYLLRNIPIRSAVVAWQPGFLPPDGRCAPPGQIGVFEFLDPRERVFMMTDGACYAAWAAQSVEELIRQLLWLKRQLVQDFGIAEWRVEAMFRRITEFRLYRIEQRRRRQAEKARKRASNGTR